MNNEKAITSHSLQLLRLFQLVSSNLPVGGYTFSQGLEYAIDSGWLKSESDVKLWIEQYVENTLIYTDLPIVTLQFNNNKKNSWGDLEYWNDYLLAQRETKELLLTELAMGEAMIRLCKGMSFKMPEFCYKSDSKIAFLTLYSIYTSKMNIELNDALTGYAWMLIENQVLAATKLLPMGQTQAQNMLNQLAEMVAICIEKSKEIKECEIGMSLPGLAMASSLHETQYSRLYRS